MRKRPFRPEIPIDQARAVFRCLTAGLANPNYIFNADETDEIKKFIDKITEEEERVNLIQLVSEGRGTLTIADYPPSPEKEETEVKPFQPTPREVDELLIKSLENAPNDELKRFIEVWEWDESKSHAVNFARKLLEERSDG